MSARDATRCYYYVFYNKKLKKNLLINAFYIRHTPKNYYFTIYHSKKYGHVSVSSFSFSVGCAISKHESHQKNGEHIAISSP